VGRRLKEVLPNVRIVGADPVGSVLGGGEAGALYMVEGIGYDFFPRSLDRSVVDEWVKTDDPTAFALALRLVREEAMLVGGSSGSAMQAALKVAETAPEGSRIVVILADNIRNYMTKFLDPDWMAEKGFPDPLA
ncbi:pyridoxal-phosphate dependent enzyme, partial [bacterium]